MTDPQPAEGLYGEPPPPAPQACAPGLLEQVLGLYTEPVTLFQRLHDTPVWKGPVGLTLVFSLVMTVLWSLKVDVEAMVRPILEADPRLAADQIDRMVALQTKFILPGGVAGVFIGITLGLLGFSLLYWLIGKGTAEAQPPTFLQVVAMTAVTSLVTIPHQLLIIIRCLLKPVGGLTPDKLAPTSLGYFLTVNNLKLQTLFYKLDLFTLFTIVLLYLGARHALRLKTTGAVACSAVAALLMIVLPAVFGH
jgi:hypothetical protein